MLAQKPVEETLTYRLDLTLSGPLVSVVLPVVMDVGGVVGRGGTRAKVEDRGKRGNGYPPYSEGPYRLRPDSSEKDENKRQRLRYDRKRHTNQTRPSRGDSPRVCEEKQENWLSLRVSKRVL